MQMKSCLPIETAPPRPLPSAILAEFDRQRENAARFRRKSAHVTDNDSAAAVRLLSGSKDHEFHPFPEVATFTLFFMTFTSLIGKELIIVADNPSFSEDHTIFSSVSFNEKAPTAAEIFRSSLHSQEKVTGDESNEKEVSTTPENQSSKHKIRVDERSEDSLDEFKELDTSSIGSNDEMKKKLTSVHDECESVNNLAVPKILPPESSDFVHGGEDVVSSIEDVVEKDGEASNLPTDQVHEVALSNDQSAIDNSPHELIIEEDMGEGENQSKTIIKTSLDSENGIVPNGTHHKVLESQDDLSRNNVSIVSESDSNDGEANDLNFSSTGTYDQGSIHDISFSAGSNEDGKSQGGSRKIVMPRILKEVSTRSLQSLKTLSKSLVSPNLSSQVEQSRLPRPRSAEDIRSRFTDKLNVLELEEAKATAKAQIGMAFEILQMMRERGLKADPSVYQCLIEACGRCGDTDHATLLLSRMHDDGIVADGVVYACLVSAFSAENAWKKKIGKTKKDLPGENH
jgi:pentatricopeptide repeat protein